MMSAWELTVQFCSVTPLKANFAHGPLDDGSKELIL